MDTNLNPAICAVVQIPDIGGRLHRCYDEVYLPAIAEAGLIADVLSVDSEASPNFAERIAAADVCFADITEDNPALWMILGCAVALRKPLCIVAAQNADQNAEWTGASVPLPLSAKIISYPMCSLPSDYATLRRCIVDSLSSVSHPPLESSISRSGPSSSVHSTSSNELDASLALLPKLTSPPVQQSVENEPSLSAYEIIALSLIAQDTAPEGMGVGKLAQYMHKFGLVRATSLAVNRLRRKDFVVRHEIPLYKHGITKDTSGVSITPSGSDWLNTHATSVEHAFSINAPPDEPTDLIGLLATLRLRG